MQLILAISIAALGAGERPLDLKAIFEEGIPPSPFMDPVDAYADALLATGTIARPNAIRLLLFLEELSGEARYAAAAESALRALLARTDGSSLPGPWLLWGPSFAIAPEDVVRIVRDPSLAAKAKASAREAGFAIRAWAEAHARIADPSLLRAIEDTLRSLDPNRAADPAARLSLAIDCEGAARKVPEPLRSRLLRRAAQEDERFLRAAEDPAGPRIGILCVSRYANAADIRFRDRILRAADSFLASLPEALGNDPMALGQAIGVELAAFRAAPREPYLRGAIALGEIALERFFSGGPGRDGGSAGLDSPALALVELHLTVRGISAARAPVNSADR